MLSCTYYGSLADRPITEYFPVLYEGYAGQKALQALSRLANFSRADLSQASNMQGEPGLDYISLQMSNSNPPKIIDYRMDGKFFRILKQTWK